MASLVIQDWLYSGVYSYTQGLICKCLKLTYEVRKILNGTDGQQRYRQYPGLPQSFVIDSFHNVGAHVCDKFCNLCLKSQIRKCCQNINFLLIHFQGTQSSERIFATFIWTIHYCVTFVESLSDQILPAWSSLSLLWHLLYLKAEHIWFVPQWAAKCQNTITFIPWIYPWHYFLIVLLRDIAN